MLTAGWHAHTLNAPGKFLISAPEHTTPRRARAYLVTGEDVARTAAHYAASRPQLDDVSSAAIHGPAAEPAAWYDTGDPQDDAGKPTGAPDGHDMATPEGALWLALCVAPEEGADIAELLRASGMSGPPCTATSPSTPGPGAPFRSAADGGARPRPRTCDDPSTATSTA